TGGKIGEVTATGRTAVLVGYGPRNTTAKRRPRKQAPAPAATAPVATAPPVTAPAAPAPAPAPARVAPAASPAPAAAPARSGPALAKPPVRKLARDLGVDLHTLTGTGPGGSITREDVQAAVAARVDGATAPTFGPDREQRIPIKGVRKLTAENMVASAFTAPHVTEFLTVDVTRGVRALKRLDRKSTRLN